MQTDSKKANAKSIVACCQETFENISALGCQDSMLLIVSQSSDHFKLPSDSLVYNDPKDTFLWTDMRKIISIKIFNSQVIHIQFIDIEFICSNCLSQTFVLYKPEKELLLKPSILNFLLRQRYCLALTKNS